MFGRVTETRTLIPTDYSCLFGVAPLQYLCLLLCVFLLEIIAGVLAYITYQEVKSITFNWDVIEQRIYVKT